MGSTAIDRAALVFVLWRLGRMGLVTYLVAMGTWTLLGPAPRGASVGVSSVRAVPLARGGLGPAGAWTLTVSVDGLVSSARGSGTVAETLGQLGLATRPADVLSSPASAPVVPGQRITVDRGVPVTLMDGGSPLATRGQGTVGDLLVAENVSLGPLDRVDRALTDQLAAGDIVRITRTTEIEVVATGEVPFRVRFVPDPDLDQGHQLVIALGEPGQVLSTFLVRVVDGSEVERRLLSTEQISQPVDELRRLGTRVPRAPADIEVIIREAAARQGADAEQLVRVAYCESRFNPNAYNPSGASGLFQFMPRTWAANSVRAGYAGASPFDPVAAANVAAWMFARGSASLWSCK